MSTTDDTNPRDDETSTSPRTGAGQDEHSLAPNPDPDDPGDDPDAMRLQLGRRAPFTQVPDWVALADIPQKKIAAQAKMLYWLLAAHLNTTRGDRRVWPTQRSLAKMLGYSRGDKIKPLLDALVELNAIEITKTRYRGGMRERSLYIVHETPPEDYAGCVDLGAFYRDHREELRKPEARRGKRKEVDAVEVDDDQLAIDDD